jgi:hypothetical protein
LELEAHYNGIDVVATADKFLVQLGDRWTLHTVPRRHILEQHLIAKNAVTLLQDIFDLRGDAAQAIDRVTFEKSPMVAGPFAPANYHTLPDGSRHLCIMVAGVAQWHHCPAPSCLNELIAETATLSPDAAAEQVLCRLDGATQDYYARVLDAMAPKAA